VRLTWALLPALAAGCVAGLPAATDAPPAANQSLQLARQVTLRVDPSAPAASAREVLATIESQLNLDFSVANLRQADGNTTFELKVANRGSALSNLELRLSSDRTMMSPGNPIALGPLATGGETAPTITYGNATGGAFTVTIYLWATLSATGGQSTGTSTSSPAPTTAPTATVTVAPTTAPTSTPTTAPTATPPSSVETAPNPGPLAVRGRILSNGKVASGWTTQSFSYGRVELSLKRVVNNGWVESIPVTTDAQGYFTATNLVEGDYIAYFYNEIYRDRMGVWKSLPVRVSASSGGAFPVVDLYLKGQENLPLPGASTALPATFTFEVPRQPMASQRFRLHSQGGTSFTLVYVSNKFPGDRTTFTWDGTGTRETLAYNRDYFWGLEWDGGPLGAFGNLYQKIKFVQ
jgi:hypothetical protein